MTVGPRRFYASHVQKRWRWDEKPDACGDVAHELQGLIKGAVLAAESDLREAEAGNKRKQHDLFDTVLLIFARSSRYKDKESRYVLKNKRRCSFKKEKRPIAK